MIIRSEGAVEVESLRPGWATGVPQGSHEAEAIVPYRDADPVFTELHASSLLQNKLSWTVSIADADFRSNGATYPNKPTKHRLEVRSGVASNNVLLIRNMAVRTIRMLMNGTKQEDSNFYDSGYSGFRGRSLIHFDDSGADPNDHTYFYSNLDPTLAWEQRFFIRNEKNPDSSPLFINLALLRIQARRGASIQTQTDVMYRMRTRNGVHAKARDNTQEEENRVFVRDFVSRKVKNKK